MENPYKPPESSLKSERRDSQFSRHGRYVVMDPESKWPSRCIKCNKATESEKKIVLTYLNPWIYLSIFITPLLTLILYFIFRKRFETDLPLCKVHIKRRKYFLFFQWSMLTIFIVCLLSAISAGSDALGILAIICFLIVFVSSLFGRLAFAAKYKEELLWITGSSKGFRNSLPDMYA